jgi:hypothetical protein
VDSWGQATFQQPLQVVGVLPTFTAGMSGFTAGMSGFAKGVAGVVLGSGAAMNGSKDSGRSGRTRRQTRKGKQASQNTNALSTDAGVDEDWYDCQEYDTTETGETNHKVTDAALISPRADTQNQLSADEFERLAWQLDNDEEREVAIANMRGSVLRLALDSQGCRLIQFALDVISQKEAAELVSELQGHVLALIDSKHGNYVLQKMVEVLPTSMASFVGSELKGMIGEVARHRYGCRILCRLFEHSGTEGGSVELVEELLSEVHDLSRHAYGYHVIRCILEHGLPDHRRRIANALCSGAQRHAKHRHSSFVIEKAIAHCDENARAVLTSELLQRPENVVDLARHQFGRHVVSQLVRSPGDCSQKALHNLRTGLAQVKTSKHGRRLIEELKQQLIVSAAG